MIFFQNVSPMVKKIVMLMTLILVCSCSPKVWLTSDSDVLLESDRATGKWSMIWTWKLSKGRTVSDTIPVRVEQEEKIFKVDSTAVE